MVSISFSSSVFRQRSFNHTLTNQISHQKIIPVVIHRISFVLPNFINKNSHLSIHKPWRTSAFHPSLLPPSKGSRNSRNSPIPEKRNLKRKIFLRSIALFWVTGMGSLPTRLALENSIYPATKGKQHRKPNSRTHRMDDEENFKFAPLSTSSDPAGPTI